MLKANKKGYYFVIDALVGSTIIFISLMILLSSTAKPTKVQYNYELAEEYSTFIITTKIRELSNPYLTGLILSGMINDTSKTIVEQIDYFYYKNDTVTAGLLVRNLTEPLIPEKYGFEYNIITSTNKTNIYLRNSTDIANARLVISSRKITFLQIDSSTMFGPAIVEVKIWI